jgi:TRAP-type mannitol/chloroaromatic compound transport system permease small subunit
MRLIDSLNEKIGKSVSWLSAVLVVVVTCDVFARYVLSVSSIAVQEIEWHLFAIIFMLAGAYTLGKDKHVRIDILYQRMGKKGRAVVDLAGTLIFLIPFAILVIWTSADFVHNSFVMRESSPDAGGLPFRYLIKAVIPLSFFLILLQGLSLAVKSLMVLTGHKEQKHG